MEIKKIAVLMAVFNRIEMTIKCLENFKLATLKTPEINYEIYILDDASTDSTNDIISNLYPNIKLVSGNGNLYWCRGMIKAWEVASKSDYDAYILLNNDSYVYENGLEILLGNALKNNYESIISGAFRSAFTNVSTYGGRLKGEMVTLTPNGKFQKIELLNGNLVFIPKVVYKKIGKLDSLFHHAIGDYDYGLRAIKNGFKVLLTEQYVGTCESHDKVQGCYDINIPIIKRLNIFYSPLGDNPIQRYFFLKRHYSFFKAIIAFLSTHVYVIFPNLLKWYETKKIEKSI